MKYNKKMGLSKYEYQLEKIVDKIKKEQSTLICINLLKQYIPDNNSKL